MQNDNIGRTITAEIRRADFFLIFLSSAYVERPNTRSEFNAISARERVLFEEDEKRAKSADETIFPRVYIIYMSTVREIESPNQLNEVTRNLQPRKYFDFREVHMLRESDIEFRRAAREIADIIVGRLDAEQSEAISMPEVVYQVLERLPHFSNTAREATKAKLRDITAMIEAIPNNLRFRSALIDSLLDGLASELENLNADKYDHNISLNVSFLKRASPIFANADVIYAVSVDSLSSFWLSESSRGEAKKYADAQRSPTYRMFVFSSPCSMYTHHPILAEHFEQYGADGRVLFTTRRVWEAYLLELESKYDQALKDAGCDQSNWISSRLGGDFGILRYGSLGEPTYLETILSKDNLRFRHMELTPFHRQIMNDLQFPTENYEYAFGEAGLVHRWKEAYADEQVWFQRIAATFPTASSVEAHPERGENEVPPCNQIIHLVLFSKLVRRDDFLAGIRVAIPPLMEIIGSSNKPLVQELWYGGLDSAFPPGFPPRAPLRISNEISENWPHCLMMRFRSHAELEEYYGDATYARVRMELYRGFSTALSQTIDQIEAAGTEELKHELGETLEEMASRYVVRLDFSSHDPFLRFRRASVSYSY